MTTTKLILLAALLVGCTAEDVTDEEWGALEDDGEMSSVPTHDPDYCPSGGVPVPTGKKPIPEPRDCSQIRDPVACRDCCEWNVEKVWGERCRRMPRRTDEQKRARRACWEDAERRRANCHSDCPIEILTLTVTP